MRNGMVRDGFRREAALARLTAFAAAASASTPPAAALGIAVLARFAFGGLLFCVRLFTFACGLGFLDLFLNDIVDNISVVLFDGRSRNRMLRRDRLGGLDAVHH